MNRTGLLYLLRQDKARQKQFWGQLWVLLVAKCVLYVLSLVQCVLYVLPAQFASSWCALCCALFIVYFMFSVLSSAWTFCLLFNVCFIFSRPMCALCLRYWSVCTFMFSLFSNGCKHANKMAIWREYIFHVHNVVKIYNRSPLESLCLIAPL